MEKELKKYENKYLAKVKNAKKMEKTLLGKISELEKSVIKPQYFELKIKDEIIKRYKKEFELNMKDLKMLKSILKIPVLCQEFQRAFRKNLGA